MIGCVVLIYGLLPLGFCSGKVAQDKLPAYLSDLGYFIGNAILDENH